MPKSIKLKNNTYIDSTGIVHNKKLLSQIINEIGLITHPVGSVYINVNSTNPATLFGGTWERIAKGRCLMGQGVVEPNNDNWCGTINAGDWTAYNGGMGGEVFHGLTIEEMPSHTHTSTNGKSLLEDTGSSDNEFGWHIQDTSGYRANGSWLSNAGGNRKHNNMPPYLVVYMWKRTA